MSYGGRLILINSVLTSMPMFLLSFFEVPLVFGRDWTSIDRGSFGRVMSLKENTDLLNGISSVDRKTKGVLV